MKTTILIAFAFTTFFGVSLRAAEAVPAVEVVTPQFFGTNPPVYARPSRTNDARSHARKSVGKTNAPASSAHALTSVATNAPAVSPAPAIPPALSPDPASPTGTVRQNLTGQRASGVSPEVLQSAGRMSTARFTGPRRDWITITNGVIWPVATGAAFVNITGPTDLKLADFPDGAVLNLAILNPDNFPVYLAFNPTNTFLLIDGLTGRGRYLLTVQNVRGELWIK